MAAPQDYDGAKKLLLPVCLSHCKSSSAMHYSGCEDAVVNRLTMLPVVQNRRMHNYVQQIILDNNDVTGLDIYYTFVILQYGLSTSKRFTIK